MALPSTVIAIRGVGKFRARASSTIPSVTNDATVGNKTYTAAEVSTGMITRDPAGGARTDVLPSAETLISTLKLNTNGDYFDCLVINTADAAETIVFGGAPTGVTYVNATVIGQNEAMTMRIRRTSSTTVSVYFVGS